MWKKKIQKLNTIPYLMCYDSRFMTETTLALLLLYMAFEHCILECPTETHVLTVDVCPCRVPP